MCEFEIWEVLEMKQRNAKFTAAVVLKPRLSNDFNHQVFPVEKLQEP